MASPWTQTSQSSRADVIIIGAGVVGCSLAFHLARAGSRVMVFEKGMVCAGMSARSGALLRMHYSFVPEVQLAWKSLDYFTNWRASVGGECGFVRTGFALLVGPDNAARCRDNVAMMKRVGVEVALCDGAGLRKLDPLVNTNDIALAAYEPLSGYADPVATTRSFAAAAERHGATFVLNCAVAEVLLTGGHARGIRAGGRRYDAGAVCVVAGPWSDQLLAPLGFPIGLKQERAQIAFFRRPAGERHLAYIDCINGSYFRPHGAELTLAGMGAWLPQAEPDPDNFSDRNDPEFVGEVRRRLAARIPAMAEAEYAQGHAGIYDVSPDSRAVLGQIPGIEGLFVAAGFSGTGFKTSPAVGAAMAELIQTGRSSIDIGEFAYERIVNGALIQPENEYVMGAGFGHRL